MTIDIPDRIISEILTGVIAVLAVVGAGTLLLYILQGIAGKYPFTRLGLVIGLAPLSLYNVLDDRVKAALLIYAMIAALMGFLIDAANHMLSTGKNTETDPGEKKPEETTAASDPGGIVWEKAE